jgi:hypothetical protein
LRDAASADREGTVRGARGAGTATETASGVAASPIRKVATGLTAARHVRGEDAGAPCIRVSAAARCHVSENQVDAGHLNPDH